MIIGRFAALFASAGLLGCAGSGISSYNNDTIIGQNFGGMSAQIALEPDAVMGTEAGDTMSTSASVRFLNTTQANVTLASGTHTVEVQPDGSYQSSDGTVGLVFGPQIVGGPVTPDVLYFTILSAAHGGGLLQNSFVSGDLTTPSQLPAGAATYTGVSLMFDDALNPKLGQIDLTVDFARKSVDGEIRNGLPGDPNAMLRFDAAKIMGNGFTANLTSPDVTITTGGISGSFFGAKGDQSAGTVHVESSGGNAAGIYGALQN